MRGFTVITTFKKNWNKNDFFWKYRVITAYYTYSKTKRRTYVLAFNNFNNILFII